jgi:hypothetical protein
MGLLAGDGDADSAQSRMLTNHRPNRLAKLTPKSRRIQGLVNGVAVVIRKPTRDIKCEVKLIDQDRLWHIPSLLIFWVHYREFRRLAWVKVTKTAPQMYGAKTKGLVTHK